VVRIKLDDMKKVLSKVLTDRDIGPAEAEEIAEKVMALFGYDTTVTDNLLCKGERDLFYMLEEHDILTVEEETTILPSGKRWRIHYWRLKENKIQSILEEENVKDKEEEEESIYETLSDDVWKRVKE